MNSIELREEYNKDYYLKQVEGWKEFEKNIISQKRIDFFKGLKNLVKDKKVLDVGCGRGEMLKLAVESGCSKAIGIDYSKNAIDIASEFLGFADSDTNIKLYNYTFSEISKLRDKIDIVIMVDFLEHLTEDELKEGLERLAKKLNPGAIICGSTPKNINRGQYKNMHITQYTNAKIYEIFSKYFNTINYKEVKGDLWFSCK